MNLMVLVVEAQRKFWWSMPTLATGWCRAIALESFYGRVVEYKMEEVNRGGHDDDYDE
jgi:hypothetical protein